jgi:hypothetical protein
MEMCFELPNVSVGARCCSECLNVELSEKLQVVSRTYDIMLIVIIELVVGALNRGKGSDESG